jgi:hypothetical protein
MRQHTCSYKCEQQFDSGSGKPNHAAFDQQLAHDSSSRGAQCRSHRDLSLPRGSTRLQQIRDVGAGNEQHKRDSAHHEVERGAHGADKLLQERDREICPALVGVGIGRFEPRANSAQLRIGRIERGTGAKQSQAW